MASAPTETRLSRRKLLFMLQLRVGWIGRQFERLLRLRVFFLWLKCRNHCLVDMCAVVAGNWSANFTIMDNKTSYENVLWDACRRNNVEISTQRQVGVPQSCNRYGRRTTPQKADQLNDSFVGVHRTFNLYWATACAWTLPRGGPRQTRGMETNTPMPI